MKRFLYLLCALAFCLALTPSTALAADTAPAKLYVGDQQVIVAETVTYWTTNGSGGLTRTDNSDWNVRYDPNTATLTLNGATISGSYDEYNNPFTAGIYAKGSSNQPVALTIELIGENTITGIYGIYVDAEPGGTLGANASLNITGDGSLTATGTASYGLYVTSGTGDASLTINGASVKANTTSTYSYYAGVCVQSGSDATHSPQLSLAVDGGSLTTSASEGNDGIQFNVGSPQATNATTSLTVTDNAIVRAGNGIKASSVDKPTPSGTGIVFDGNTGTVYGDVNLDESLTVNEGETLTIPQGSTLNTNGKLTNGGTVTVQNGGTITDADTIANNGTINVENGGNLNGTPTGGTVVHAPGITTESLPNGTVGQYYSQTLLADGGGNITWGLADGSLLPDGLMLNASTGVITGTPTAAGNFTFTVIAKNSAGEASKEYTLTIEPATVPVTGVMLDQTELSLIVDGTAKLDATVEPNDATDKTVTWSSDNDDVATVDADGNVKAVAPGTATITVTTQDGSHTATCTVTVTAKTYTVSVTPSSIDFGSECPDYTQPDAQSVPRTNTGNQTVEITLPTATDYTITGGNEFTNGTASIEPKGTATFTVQPNSGLTAGTYDETLTVYGTTVTVRFTVGHEWGEPAWTWDGTTATATFTCKNDASHTQTVTATVTSTVKTAPTCTEDGTTTYTATATFNGTTYTATKNITIPATGHEWGEDGHCTICDAVKPGFTPEIIQGDESTWTKGDGQPLSFTSNAAYADFQEARVDGQTLDPVHYTVEQGSTIVTLKAAYLESLDPGEHTLDIVSSTGTATATFTITAKETQQPAKPADTDRTPAKSAGDGGQLSRGGSDIMPAVATLAILMAAGLVLGTFVLRRGRR